jgi:Trk K+ transport system NAD-binding subunit
MDRPEGGEFGEYDGFALAAAHPPAATPPDRRSPSRHIIVCGLGRFGLKIVEALRERGQKVVVITDQNTREDRILRARELGATVVEGDFRFHEIREEAGIRNARAFILATASDSANLEAALDARNESPSARIIMRLDSDKVAGRLCADFGIDAALSPPVMAARAFTRAALEPPPPPLERPANARAVSVLPRRISAPRRITHRGMPIILLLCLFGLFLGGVVVFRTALELSWVDSIYFTATILTTVGFGDFHLKEQPANVKLFGTLLMFGGVTLIAVISSVLTNFFLSGAATQLRAEQIAGRYRNHIILCGLGSVGFEIAEQLIQRKIPCVIVDVRPEESHTRNLSGRLPLLVGDATDPVVLVRAGVDRARAVIAAVSNDAINLEIGFMTQSLVEERRPARPLRIVLRCFDSDLARRIHARSNAYTLLSSAEIAAPLFVESALTEGTPCAPAPAPSAAPLLAADAV